MQVSPNKWSRLRCITGEVPDDFSRTILVNAAATNNTYELQCLLQFLELTSRSLNVSGISNRRGKGRYSGMER
jgi:hypothetical protein